MSNRVFIDSDVILDLLCKREPFYPDAAELFTLGDLGTIELVTTSVVFANVFYILRKALGIDKAKELLRKLRILVGIVPVCEKTVDLAVNFKVFRLRGRYAVLYRPGKRHQSAPDPQHQRLPRKRRRRANPETIPENDQTPVTEAETVAESGTTRVYIFFIGVSGH